jgi:hypothetical protein
MKKIKFDSFEYHLKLQIWKSCKNCRKSPDEGVFEEHILINGNMLMLPSDHSDFPLCRECLPLFSYRTTNYFDVIQYLVDIGMI